MEIWLIIGRAPKSTPASLPPAHIVDADGRTSPTSRVRQQRPVSVQFKRGHRKTIIPTLEVKLDLLARRRRPLLSHSIWDAGTPSGGRELWVNQRQQARRERGEATAGLGERGYGFRGQYAEFIAEQVVGPVHYKG